MGPVEIAIGSHQEGIVPVYEDGGPERQSGAYALRFENESEKLAPYAKAAPTSEPGDLILLDFLTFHRSGENLSQAPRWTMQFRYFNFANPKGISISWKGSYADGQNFSKLIPELEAKNDRLSNL
jgi:ectoine hydroxylase-related dioxygenase (phytanoyl-CoA dioxygenase family)